MYALWGTDLDLALASADTGAALRRAGADRVQLNVAGAPEIAGAMTLSTFAPPIDAIVSVWTEAEAELRAYDLVPGEAESDTDDDEHK